MSRRDRDKWDLEGVWLFIIVMWLMNNCLNKCHQNDTLDDIKHDVQEIKRDVWTIKYRTK